MSDPQDASSGTARPPIVSSAHLAKSRIPEVSEVEFALTICNHGFQRWIVRCMAAAGYPDLSALDVLVLHMVNHRGRAKRLADICLMLNMEDTHLVTYALKKLDKAKLITSGRLGKEKVVEVTPGGAKACETYREIRERCLISALSSLHVDRAEMSRLAELLRALSGQYDQAARAATSL